MRKILELELLEYHQKIKKKNNILLFLQTLNENARVKQLKFRANVYVTA